MCVYVCTVTEFLDFEAALNSGPIKAISVATYTIASSLVFGRGYMWRTHFMSSYDSHQKSSGK